MGKEIRRIIIGDFVSTFNLEPRVSSVEQSGEVKRGSLGLNYTERLQMKYEDSRGDRLSGQSGIPFSAKHDPIKTFGKPLKGIRFISLREARRIASIEKALAPR